MNTQFKKGVLELCVLSIVDKRDCYGYELVDVISRNIEISDGTIYPILRRLTQEGYFTTYLKESSDGPPRKYYKLTELGKHTKDTLEKEWFHFVDAVNLIVKEGERS